MLEGKLGLVELLLSGALVLGFCGYQYWTVRDAGKPKPPPSEQPPRHPEG